MTMTHFDSTTDHFDEWVNKDVRGQLEPDKVEVLQAPDNIERWYNSLLSLKKSVEAQLTTNRAELAEKQAECMAKGLDGKQEWFNAKAEADRWRAGAVRFKAGVETKLSYARSLRASQRSHRFVDVVIRERDAARGVVFEMRQAIAAHRDAVCGSTDDDEIDRAENDLWAILDREPNL